MSAETPFYDRHPYDWFEPESVGAVLGRLLRESLATVRPGHSVLDVGCGAGRVGRYLASCGLTSVGVDISRVSLRLMRAIAPCPGVAGDNLNLPIRDGAVDFVISDGVVHHTEDPKRAFLENCRVLKDGGHLYLAVYRPTGRYRSIMTSVGPAVRAAMRSGPGRLLLEVTLIPPYYLLHKIRSRGKRTYAGTRRLFYAYFGTPIIGFHTYAEVVDDWFPAGGMTLVAYDPNAGGGVHAFFARKRTA